MTYFKWMNLISKNRIAIAMARAYVCAWLISFKMTMLSLNLAALKHWPNFCQDKRKTLYTRHIGHRVTGAAPSATALASKANLLHSSSISKASCKAKKKKNNRKVKDLWIVDLCSIIFELHNEVSFWDIIFGRCKSEGERVQWKIHQGEI